MESKEEEEKWSNMKTGGESTSLAIEKKRSKSRRVSFAETTAIHLFLRDEECEEDDSSNAPLQRTLSDEIKDLLASDSDDDAIDPVSDPDPHPHPGASFLRPFESPSSGSCFGSANSNNEDNFFGPVSADFIKPGRLSDSAVSDDNHDVTMDSTAFSMHFRSLARSDCGGEFKTPTGMHGTFGERSFNQISNTSGDLMVLSGPKKRVACSAFCVDTVNESGNSDDMSVVEEKPHRYDYGELPPELDVLLVEDGKDNGANPTSHVECAHSIKFIKEDSGSGLHQNGCELLDISNRDIDAHHVSDMKKASDSAVFVIPDDENNKISGSLSNDQAKVPILPTNVMQVDEDNGARKGAAESHGNLLSPQSSSLYNLNHDQPIAGSISPLLSKRTQILRASPNNKSNMILSEKFCDNVSKQVLSASSFEKGVSRLKRFEAFPFGSASKVESNASRLMPPNSLTRNSLINESRKYALMNDFAAPVVCLDKFFLNVAEDNHIIQSMYRKGKNDFRTLGEECASATRAEDAEHAFLNETLSSHDKPTKSVDVSVSSLVISKEKQLEPYMSSDNHNREFVLSTENHCSLLENSFNDLKCNSETRISPKTNAGRNISASPLYQESFFKKPNQYVESILGVDRIVLQKADGIASRSENSSSLYTERKHEVERPFPKGRHFETRSEEIQNEDSMLKSVYGSSVMPACSQAALIDKASDSCKVVAPGANVEDGLISARALPVISMKPDTGFSPTADYNQNELPIQMSKSSIKILSRSLVQQKPYNANADVFLGSTVLTPRSYQLSKHVETDQLLQKPSNVYGSDRSSTLKRKLFDEVRDDIDEIASSQQKSKLCKGQKHSLGDRKLPYSIGSDATRDWVDVFTSFCGMTKLLPSFVHELDLAQIRMLNETLAHLDKMRTYELLHRDMCSQREFDAAHILQIKRLVDTKLLLYKNLYQKAKLQLICLERDKLLDQVRQLDSRVEESKKLISSCHDSRILGHKDVEVDFSLSGSDHIDPGGMSLGAVDIPSLREELVMSEGKIRNLYHSFHAYTKVMKELTCSETTVHVRKFLMKRVACRLPQSEFQLCQVASIKAMDGKLNILIDYAGIMVQRFTVKCLSTSDLYVSNTLNDMNICKMFRSMDACNAFSFVLCGETHHACSIFGIIAQQIQKSISLLQSVLDVVQEVELAMSELRNLTGTSFFQPSAGKLELILSFTDFKSGARVALGMDITCLKWGIYPSQVLPYEVKGTAARSHKSFQSLVDNIKSAVGGVRCGYRRILNLCQCVSRTIQVNCLS